MSMLRVCGLSHKGQVRAENQDAFLINGMVEQELLGLKLAEEGLFFTRYGLLCAVADGMGGHRGGSVASKQALEALVFKFSQLAELENVQQASKYLQRQILNIHRRLLERGAREPELAGMGTTLSGVYLRPSFAFYFHAGDSRLYRFRAGALMQLTSDHRPEVAFGTDSARFDRGAKSGVITNCLGCKAANCSPESKEISFREKDILLLCSDGLSDMLELEAMEAIFEQEQDLAETARQLVSEANVVGGLDNITLVLIKKEGDYRG